MDLPSISIITPSFNQGAYLEQTILSVLNQRYPRLHYGVVDGGSTDGSPEILRRYEKHLAYGLAERDGGQSEAINKGLRRARGEVVGWLCSDDMLTPGALAAVGRYFADNPGERWLAGKCLTIDAYSRRIAVLSPTRPVRLLDALLRSREQPFELPQPAVFWRRSLHDELGLLDESLHYCMDFEWWCRLLAAGNRPAVLADTLAMYRIHGTSKTCSQASGFLREHLVVERRYARYVPLKRRLSVYRRLGYRRRQYEGLRGRAALLGQLAVHPWWLASQQVWTALRGRGTAA